MCPPGYYQKVFLVTDAFGHIMFGYTLVVQLNQRLLDKLSKELDINGDK